MAVITLSVYSMGTYVGTCRHYRQEITVLDACLDDRVTSSPGPSRCYCVGR